MTPAPDTRTVSERIRAARRAQQLADFEQHGYPLELVAALNADPNLTLDEALDFYAVPARRVA